MFSIKKYSIYIGIINLIAFVVSLFYKKGSTYSFLNALFLVGGVFLIVSGIRFVYEMGGYNLLIYSFRKISFFQSGKKKYVEEVLSEHELDEQKKNDSDVKVTTKKKAKDMSYEEFVHNKKDEWGMTNELFSASLTAVVLSILIGMLIIK